MCFVDHTQLSLSPAFEDIEIVPQVKLLGVIISDNFSFESHLNAILSRSSQRFYLLKLLRDGGMPICKLNVIYTALVVNCISYCLSAWGGFLNSEQIGRINALFRRAVKYRFTENTYDFVGILLHTDSAMFRAMQCENHCLNSYLPAIKPASERLRNRRHNFVLPVCRYQVFRNSFLPRCLYEFL